VARIAAARVGRGGAVVGVDLNPGMLNVARTIKTTEGAASVQWQEASADRLPFPNGSFDIAYCQLGLQFFADRKLALEKASVIAAYRSRSPLACSQQRPRLDIRRWPERSSRLATRPLFSQSGATT
jgi:2-polyprenyl-3-methyl-5-hydroxy-6-metoxy-1,4-benzoquinol methylase